MQALRDAERHAAAVWAGVAAAAGASGIVGALALARWPGDDSPASAPRRDGPP